LGGHACECRNDIKINLGHAVLCHFGAVGIEGEQESVVARIDN